jgi:hypothetical protein
MAEKSESTETPVELRQRIASSRQLVARDMGGLRYELNFPLKLKKAFHRHTAVFVGTALALGLLVALLRTRTKKIYLSAGGSKVQLNKALLDSGLLLGAIKMGMTLVQPMVASYFAKKGAKKGARARAERNR